MSLSPAALADVLAALPVRVSSVRVEAAVAAVDDYPGGRPTSVVRLAGAGEVGCGENVAFTEAEQNGFAARASAQLAGAEGGVGALLPPDLPRYERAALEAALVDLAMRQAGTSLAALTGRPGFAPSASMRFVVSFAATADPVARVRELGAAGHQGAFKIDVDPGWSEATCQALVRTLRPDDVAVLDFKGRGEVTLARVLAATFPGAIFEDPPDGTTGVQIARDAALADARAVAAAVARREAINLKAPRMGGPLELLRGLELAIRAGVTVYVGGMFEVGVGRAQARQLAALYCPDAPNDLAPLARPFRETSPLAVALHAPGFGEGR